MKKFLIIMNLLLLLLLQIIPASASLNSSGIGNTKDMNTPHYHYNTTSGYSLLQKAAKDVGGAPSGSNGTFTDSGVMKVEWTNTILNLVPSANAEGTTVGDTTKSTAEDQAGTVVVTEAIPGLDCKKEGGDTAVNKKYRCKVSGNFGGVMGMLQGLIKYVAFLAILVAILMMVISGVRMSIEGKKDDAKKMFGNVVKSLIVLFLMGFILNTIAPWFYK